MTTVDLPGIVCNDDWATPAADMPHLARKYRPKWFATQESKGIGGYASRVVDDGYRVRQDMHSQATQGVTVGWDSDSLRAIATGRGHSGWHPLVEGGDLLARGVVWQDLELVAPRLRSKLAGHHRIRLASTHRPPLRDHRLWATFDHHLRTWAATSPYPLVVGMDSNQEGGPRPLVGRAGRHRLAWHGHRIDGVLTDLRVTKVIDLPERTSDHRPLAVKLRP